MHFGTGQCGGRQAVAVRLRGRHIRRVRRALPAGAAASPLISPAPRPARRNAAASSYAAWLAVVLAPPPRCPCIQVWCPSSLHEVYSAMQDTHVTNVRVTIAIEVLSAKTFLRCSDFTVMPPLVSIHLLRLQLQLRHCSEL